MHLKAGSGNQKWGESTVALRLSFGASHKYLADQSETRMLDKMDQCPDSAGSDVPEKHYECSAGWSYYFLGINLLMPSLMQQEDAFNRMEKQ